MRGTRIGQSGSRSVSRPLAQRSSPFATRAVRPLPAASVEDDADDDVWDTGLPFQLAARLSATAQSGRPTASRHLAASEEDDAQDDAQDA